MIAIDVVEIRPVIDPDGNVIAQYAEVEASDGIATYRYRQGDIPLGLDVEEYAEQHKDRIWETARQEGEIVRDLPASHENDALLKACIEVLLDEINLLRSTIAELAPSKHDEMALRTMKQARIAIVNKLKSYR